MVDELDKVSPQRLLLTVAHVGDGEQGVVPPVQRHHTLLDGGQESVVVAVLRWHLEGDLRRSSSPVQRPNGGCVVVGGGIESSVQGVGGDPAEDALLRAAQDASATFGAVALQEAHFFQGGAGVLHQLCGFFVIRSVEDAHPGSGPEEENAVSPAALRNPPDSLIQASPCPQRLVHLLGSVGVGRDSRV